MHRYQHTVGSRSYVFNDLKDLMMTLAALPQKVFLTDCLIPNEDDEVTRLIIDEHDTQAFAQISHLTVGDFRNWLLSDDVDTRTLQAIARGVTPSD